MSHNTFGVCENKCFIPLNGEINNVNVPKSGWVLDVDHYTNTVAVKDIKEHNFPVYMDIDWENSTDDLATIMKNKSRLSHFTYTDGQIIFHAAKVPSIDLVVRLTGVGVSSEVNA